MLQLFAKEMEKKNKESKMRNEVQSSNSECVYLLKRDRKKNGKKDRETERREGERVF